MQCPQGQQVVAAENGGDTLLPQDPGALLAGIQSVEIAGVEIGVIRAHIDTGIPHGALKAGESLSGGGHIALAVDEADFSVPQSQQLGGQLPEAGIVVVIHKVSTELGIGDLSAEQGKGYLTAHFGDETAVFSAGIENNAVHLFFPQQGQALGLPLLEAVGRADEEVVAPVIEYVFNAPGHAGEEVVGDIRDHQTDGFGAVVFQGAGNGVGMVAQTLNGLEHTLDGLFLDGSLFV